MDDATNRETEKTIDRPHPLAVTLGQVIVHRDDVDPASGKRVEECRQGSDERLAFAGGHFRDHAAVQGDAADELHVEGHHLPAQGVIAHRDVGAAHAAAGILHHGERLGQDGLQFARQFGVVLDGGELGLPRGGLVAEHLLGLGLQRGLELVDALHQRPEALQFALVLRAEDFFENKSEHVKSGGRRYGKGAAASKGKKSGQNGPQAGFRALAFPPAAFSQSHPLAMTLTQTLQQLEAAGTAETRKTYARHGVGRTCSASAIPPSGS